MIETKLLELLEYQQASIELLVSSYRDQEARLRALEEQLNKGKEANEKQTYNCSDNGCIPFTHDPGWEQGANIH